jgi:hypothetical protein
VEPDVRTAVPERVYNGKGIYLTNRILERVGISVRQRAELPLVRRGISWKADPTSPEIKQRYPDRFRIGFSRIVKGWRLVEAFED